MVKMIFSIVVLAVSGAIFFFYTQPQFDNVRLASAEVKQYDSALERAAELQQLKQTLLSRYNSFNPQDIERLQKLLPDHVDNVRLVLDLDRLAAKHRMGLQNVVITNPMATASGEENSPLETIGENLQKYDSLTLKFATQGTYDDFTAFMEDLENSLRIVDLQSLKMSREAAALPNGEFLYRFDIIVKTYWLK